jgi:hypothetical protein
MSRHSELLAMAAQRDADAETARRNRDQSTGFDRGAYDQQAEDAHADARLLRFTVADEQWQATR